MYAKYLEHYQYQFSHYNFGEFQYAIFAFQGETSQRSSRTKTYEARDPNIVKEILKFNKWK